MTVEEAESEIGAFLAKFPFAVDPKVLERLDADMAEPAVGTGPGCLGYAAAQEETMLADFAKRMGPILERRAVEVRTRHSYFPVFWTRAAWPGRRSRR